MLETGEPLEIERNGRRLRVVRDEPKPKLPWVPHPGIIVGDPEDLVHIDWSEEWDEDNAIDPK